ncbi:hypothetical protein MLD38_002731 [Melastoma candidum]|uniref:Uncharacterized protein n=1 Tax=Melastoma candidum TaxID=119954 RepID=A0ACB9S430_9MYRT|nr:hypothetical protein MLD38_002731 [Melastoma candidum]
MASSASGVVPLPMPCSVSGVNSSIRLPARASSFACLSTVSSVDHTVGRIEMSGVIACLRSDSAEVAMEAACAALIGGISVLEIVMSTPGVLEILPQLVRDHPAATLGVGTVLNFTDAQKAIAAGAKFLMSPSFIEDVLTGTRDSNILYIPGVMTPTEVLLAHNMGAKVVKVYPVSALGGVHYISALKKPFSHIPMVASQGISIDAMTEYILKGASAVVLSDAIFSKDAIAERDFHQVSRLAGLAAQQGSEAVERKRRYLHC